MDTISEASEPVSTLDDYDLFVDKVPCSLSLEQMALSLERSVPVRDNRWRMKVYTNTFVGKECVDFLVRAKFASSRAKAVDLGRKIAKELNIFEHVCSDHELKDEFLFFRFVDEGRRTKRPSDLTDVVELKQDDYLLEIADKLRKKLSIQDRYYRLKKYKKCFIASDAVSYMVDEGFAGTREEAVDLGRRLQNDLILWRHVLNDHQFNDGYFFYRFADQFSTSSKRPGDNVPSEGSLYLSVSEIPRKQLSILADQLRRGVRVKTRSYRLKNYRSCFVTSEAIDFMIRENIVKSREEGVELGRRLGRELNLWYHVANDHEFSDKYFFFRFSSSDHSSDEESISTDTSNCYCKSASTGTWSAVEEESLSDIASKLVRGVRVKDRTYRMKRYKACFVGSEAVDFMVQARLASSRKEAVGLGRHLANDLGLFRHVKGEHLFEDLYFFYHFASADEENSLSTDNTSQCKETSDTQSIHTLDLDDLQTIGEQLRKSVQVKDRSFRLKTYRNSFVGSEAVDFLVQSGLTGSRAGAVEVGRRLVEQLDFFYHVTYDRQFEDDFLFYRFNAADRSFSCATTADWNGSMDSVSISLHSSIQEFTPKIYQRRLVIERSAVLRSHELAELKMLRKNICDGAQVVLVGGASGSGKSRLVESAFAGDGSILFGTAKFDQDAKKAPFATLRLLFSDLCKRLQMSRSMKECQERLQDEFVDAPSQRAALASWIPETRNFFALSTKDPEGCRKPSDSINTIKLALQSFLLAVSSVTPVVLCLDDLMWSDAYTLDILHFLLHRNMKNLLVCVTYRENEVNDPHPLLAWQAEVADNVSLHTLLLHDLTLAEIQDFLSESLGTDAQEVEALSILMRDRTHGNLVFVIQLLETLQNLGLLMYDDTRMQWVFSVEECRVNTFASDNVAKMLSMRIEQLPRDVEQLLKLASCFGSTFDSGILEVTKTVLFVFDDVHCCLQEACDEQLLIQISDHEYKFAHDQVLQAASDLLPSGVERERIHFDIGYELSKKLASRQDDGTLFACADQLMLSEKRTMIRLLQARDGPRIAKIFLAAGERAAAMSAFLPSSEYLYLGITVLGDDVEAAFADHYDIALKIFSTYARTELSAGHIVESRGAAESVLAFARTENDKQQANLTLIRSYTAENEMEKQVDFALSVLDDLGQKIPKNPKFVQCTLEYERAKSALKGRSEDEILSLRHMTDKNIEFGIGILCDLIMSAYSLGINNFVSFALSRMVQLTMKHGLCGFTPLIFVLVGQDFIASFNDLKQGYHFLQVGLRCQNVVEAEDKGRLLTHSCMALGCVEAVSKCMYLALDGFKESMQIGDIHSAFHASCVYLWSFFQSGLSITPLLEDVEKFALQMLEYKQYFLFFMTTPIFQMLLCLTDRSLDPADIEKGKAVEMHELVPGDKLLGVGRETLNAYGLQLSFYMGDIEKATGYYEQLKDVNMGIVKATILYHVRLYFFALVCIENYRRSRKNRFKSEAKKYMDTLRELVENGALNLVHKLQLVDAEYASTTLKDLDEVQRKYEQAIVSASRAGFLPDSALSSYLCANFCLGRPDKLDAAESHLWKAYDVYSEWGAIAVAESIKRRHPFSFPEAPPEPVRKSSGFRSRTHFRESLVLMHKSLSKAKSMQI